MTSTTQKPVNDIAGLLSQSASKKTLIVCPIGVGTFIMATPALKALATEIGSDNLHLLALRGGIRDIAGRSGLFEKVFVWNPDLESKRAGIRVLMQMRREHYGFCVMLFPTSNWRYSLFALLTGAKKRIGFDYLNTKLPRLVQHISRPINIDAHDTDQNSELINMLVGEAERGPRKLLFPYEPIHPHIEQLKRERYIVIHPGSSVERRMTEKRLPTEAFATIAKRIYAAYGLKCVVVGGPGEEPLILDIKHKAPEAALDYTSRNFNELAAIMTYAQFYLGNDSGLMHIAAALDKPCIAFFGPSDDKRTGPYDDNLRHGKTRHLVIRHPDLLCSPCWSIKTVGSNPPCIYGDVRCLRQLDINRAWPQIDSYIARMMTDLKSSSAA